MKKILTCSLILMFSFLLIGCEKMNSTKKITTEVVTKKESNAIEILADSNFEQGFNLLGVSTADDGRTVQKILDYEGDAIDSESTPWYMAQWWTPYNVVNAVFSERDGMYFYETPSRKIAVKPDNSGYLYFELLGSVEYDSGTRVTASQNWPHLLIEQTFTNKQPLMNLKELNIHLEVSVEMCEDKNGEVYNPNLHAAQLLWYFTLSNDLSGIENTEGLGVDKDFLWFGVPIFDNRYDFIKSSARVDEGFTGGTNKLIYTMGSSMYFNESLKYGKTYTIDIDILPFLKEAYIYAVNNGALVDSNYENMFLNYMNFGWELPGAFDVASKIQNMSVVAVLK